jgi:phenylglyoxylate dehydrogenase delta subunit
MKTESEIKMVLTQKQVKQPSNWKTLKPVIELKKCTGCEKCAVFCPKAAITMQDRKPKIDLSKCDACLICLRECPEAAIREEKL